MTTQQFINKNFGVPSDKERWCSSVFADNNGNVYSYGYHYPLLFKVNNKVFRNTSGYSNTTAKHINWTRDIDAIDVEITGCSQYAYNNPENSQKVPALLYLTRYDKSKRLQNKIIKAIKADLELQNSEIKQQMQSKKRKDTQVYRWLLHDFNKVQKSILLTSEVQ